MLRFNSRPKLARAATDSGSALVEFVLMSVPILLLPMATIGITMNAYLRLVLTDAAIEGARVAALADQNLSDGEARTRSLIRLSLGQNLQPEVLARESISAEGLGVISVLVRIKAPITLAVTSLAYKEVQ